MQHSNNRTRTDHTLKRLVFYALLAVFAGCGSSEVTWPSQVENDWVKNVSGKGMANVWGVIFDVAGIEDADVSINPDATLGTSFTDSVGKNEIFFGSKVVKLETTGTKSLMLSINGKKYGKVHLNSRVVVDQKGTVHVDQELRKPVK